MSRHTKHGDESRRRKAKKNQSEAKCGWKGKSHNPFALDPPKPNRSINQPTIHNDKGTQTVQHGVSSVRGVMFFRMLLCLSMMCPFTSIKCHTLSALTNCSFCCCSCCRHCFCSSTHHHKQTKTVQSNHSLVSSSSYCHCVH